MNIPIGYCGRGYRGFFRLPSGSLKNATLLPREICLARAFQATQELSQEVAVFLLEMQAVGLKRNILSLRCVLSSGLLSYGVSSALQSVECRGIASALYAIKKLRAASVLS